MEDVLTEVPPPSRFSQDDLNNFISPSPSLPAPFLVFANPKPEKPLQPSLLVIALSPPSLHVLHHFSSKTLIGSLILPEVHFSGNTLEPSLGDKTCNVYAAKDTKDLMLFVSVQCNIPAERSHVVARLLIGGDIVPERVLILDSVQSRNFRGKLSPDESYAFKLESSAERKSSAEGPSLLEGVDYFPSGSMIDGLPAALLSRCQLRNIKGTLCVTWPEYGSSMVALVQSLVSKNILPTYASVFSRDVGRQSEKISQIKKQPFDSEMYT